jgi:hypothetical protein
MPLGLDRSDRTQKGTCEHCCERATCKQDRRSAVSAGITQTIFASRLKSRLKFRQRHAYAFGLRCAGVKGSPC